jgi:hypothetical protein
LRALLQDEKLAGSRVLDASRSEFRLKNGSLWRLRPHPVRAEPDKIDVSGPGCSRRHPVVFIETSSARNDPSSIRPVWTATM